MSWGAEATLISRLDGQAYYDDVLNITWLTDANAAAGSAFDDGASSTDGAMTWDNAVAWASSLEIAGVRGWRLPTLQPVNEINFNSDISNPSNISNNGSTDLGAGATGYGWRSANGSIANEYGWMFYGNLNGLGYWEPNGGGSLYSRNVQSGWGPQTTGPFQNLQNNFYVDYWTGLQLDSSRAWDFNLNRGGQGNWYKTDDSFAWAVHDGDLGASPVPLPTTLFLLAPAFGGLGFLRRRATIQI